MTRDQTINALRAIGINLDLVPAALVDAYCLEMLQFESLSADEVSKLFLIFKAGWQQGEQSQVDTMAANLAEKGIVL